MLCVEWKEPVGRLERDAKRPDRRSCMSKVSKFTDKQELEIVLKLLAGKLPHAWVGR